MSKPAAPRKQTVVKPAVPPPVKSDSPVQTGRRSRFPPAERQPEHVLNWEPACEWKDIMYSKNVGQGRIYQVGERVGIRGNREFIGFLPATGQEVHTYRPLGWWL
jgi:hypothetical protein